MEHSTALRVELRPIEELAPYSRNSRKHSEAQVAELANSIREWGWTAPVLADAEGIVAGHGRVMAAQRIYAEGGLIYPAPGEQAGAEPLPVGTVPVIDCTGWPEERRRAYVIADNKLALNATWDEKTLKAELDALSAAGFDVTLTGFSIDELARMADVEEVDLKAEDSDESTSGVNQKWVVIDGQKVPATEEEVAELMADVNAYIAENGMAYGYVTELLRRARAG